VVLRTLALCGLVPLSACPSSGLVPGTAYEQPVEINGILVDALPPGARPVVSVVWSDPWRGHADVAMPARWTASSVVPAADGSGDAVVSLRLFRPPPSEALVEITAPTGEVAQIALGDPVIVDDQDGDGTFHIDDRGNMRAPEAGPGDRYLAGTVALLMYVARAFPQDVAAGFPVGQLEKIGYQLIGISCHARTPAGSFPIPIARFELLTSSSLVERRTCLRTHSP
jgi:hypothetical protein